MSKERKCRTCAWWEVSESVHAVGTGLNLAGNCRYECARNTKWEEDWCRHWSETTGWDVFEPQELLADSKDFEIADLQEQLRLNKGLLRLAAELFEKDLESMSIEANVRPLKPSEAHNIGVRRRWLEEYGTKC